LGRGVQIRMIKFKGCPRCGGDLLLAEDVFGKYLSCLQCGFLRDLAERAKEPRQPVAAGEQRNQG
jgi:ribosomal protein S27AE